MIYVSFLTSLLFIWKDIVVEKHFSEPSFQQPLRKQALVNKTQSCANNVVINLQAGLRGSFLYSSAIKKQLVYSLMLKD